MEVLPTDRTPEWTGLRSRSWVGRETDTLRRGKSEDGRRKTGSWVETLDFFTQVKEGDPILLSKNGVTRSFTQEGPTGQGRVVRADVRRALEGEAVPRFLDRGEGPTE